MCWFFFYWKTNWVWSERTKYGFGPFILILKFNIGSRVMSDYINTLNLIFGVRDNKEKIEDICHSLLF